MFEQESMITCVQRVRRADDHLVAAVMSGSLTRGEGDALWGIEYGVLVPGTLLGKLEGRLETALRGTRLEAP